MRHNHSDLIPNRCVIAFDRHIRNAEFEIVGRPILQLGNPIRVLILHGKVGKQDASRICCYENQNMPDSMQIRKIRTPPRVAEELVRNPAGQRQHQHNATPNSQPQDATVAFAVFSNQQ